MGLDERFASPTNLVFPDFELPSFVDTSEAGDALFCCRPVSVVRGGTRILRVSQMSTGVPAATLVVQHRRGPDRDHERLQV